MVEQAISRFSDMKFLLGTHCFWDMRKEMPNKVIFLHFVWRRWHTIDSWYKKIPRKYDSNRNSPK